MSFPSFFAFVLAFVRDISHWMVLAIIAPPSVLSGPSHVLAEDCLLTFQIWQGFTSNLNLSLNLNLVLSVFLEY
jgi:hypothetical protein